MNLTTRLSIVIVRFVEKVFRRVFMAGSSRKNIVARSITRSPKTNARMTGFTNNDGVSPVFAPAKKSNLCKQYSPLTCTISVLYLEARDSRTPHPREVAFSR